VSERPSGRTRAARRGVLLLLLPSFFGWLGCARRSPDAEFARRIPWIERGVWLKADLHCHTVFSDGVREPAEVIARGKEFGCDVIAITDHTDRELHAATDEYFAAIAGLRAKHPELVILDGVEWNIPPGRGDDHAGVLVPPGPEGERALAELKQRFDDLGREDHQEEIAHEALRWLNEQSRSWPAPPVVIFNHPSRKAARSLDLLERIARLRDTSPLVIGFEGSPGHQGSTTLGSYVGSEPLIERWDPAAARVGDLWDQLLGRGEDLWGAIAFSDFHEEVADGLRDHWPGQFSETWLYAPERTPVGALSALRAGSFCANHGWIAREVRLTVAAAGLPRAAWAGESIVVRESATVTAMVELVVPERDWAGEPNRVDMIELIAIDARGARIVAARPPSGESPAFTQSLAVPPGGVVLRARGMRKIAGGPGLCFYTNPVRITARR
jgi:hypothetical protein